MEALFKVELEHSWWYLKVEVASSGCGGGVGQGGNAGQTAERFHSYILIASVTLVYHHLLKHTQPPS